MAGIDNVSDFPLIQAVVKRTGEHVPYDMRKIAAAVLKAMNSVGEGSEEDARFVARSVQSALVRAAKAVGAKELVLTVEGIQDAVERELMLHGFTNVAKHYILYREERARKRALEAEIPENVRDLTERSKELFSNQLAEFVYYRTYSRWIETAGRRETWIETVNRYLDFMNSKVGGFLTDDEYNEIRDAILRMEVMPSMRLMWSAGVAAERTNVAAFNCAFIAPTCIQDFAEILYVLACGTGVGFAAESRNVQQLPVVEFQREDRVDEVVIEDSKEGWADSLALGMTKWYAGRDVDFDYSLLRPEGARLKTMGGRSSGPKPLMELHQFVRRRILARQGRRLTNLDVHDIICKIGDCIVAGGVRRSALISLSDLDDVAMQQCKSGHFYISDPQRMLANNSAVYTERPTDEQLLGEWLSLVRSRSGERGIFNRGGITEQVPERRLREWERMGAVMFKPDGAGGETRLISQVGTNPCGEIYLLSKQFCNLTEVVCRPNDDYKELYRKIRIATILGTYQSMLTDYPYLSKEWKENCERERLLGVSLTGQWDCPEVQKPDVLDALRRDAVQVNREYAERFGINQSTAVTCIKPSGTVSQLVDASSGMHPRHAPYYIRRVRISASDPLFRMLKDQGLPYYPETGQTYDTATTFVLEFPVKAPEGSVFQKDVSALAQLEHWQKVKQNYTEHNPSVTISVADHEWVSVLGWIRDHWDSLGGLSFLPRDDHVYPLAPYEACTEEKYKELLRQFEGVDYSRIVVYEKEDETQGSKELACVAGVCEI